MPEEIEDTLTSDNEPQHEQQTQESGEAGGPTKAPEPWQEAFQKLSATVEKGLAPKEEKKEPTQDEINEFWGVYNPTKEDAKFFQKFFNLAEDADEMTLKEKQELFAKFQTGLVRQSITGAKRLMEKMREELELEYGPIKEQVAQQRTREIRQRFDDAYPALADKKYAKLLEVSAQELASNPASKSWDEAQYFKALAESAAKKLQDFGVPVDLGAAKTKPTATSPKLPRTTVGGSGGSGGNGRKDGKTSDDDSADLAFMR